MASHAPKVRRLPYLLMRGGTSRGGFFLKDHLPKDDQAISGVLLSVMGTIQLHPKSHKVEQYSAQLDAVAADYKQTSGIGGGTSITSKVAILSKSKDKGIDVDYRFAQVGHNHKVVDFEPSCGNILSAVGPAAIEMGLVEPKEGTTTVTIRAVNNNSLVEAIVETPLCMVTYEGNTCIDGVGGSAAPVCLNFMNVVGSKTKGKLLPTGNVRDTFNEIEVTCIDVAMPMVIAKASSFGKTGYETKADLDADTEFFQKLEAVRRVAGMKMGLGDVTGRVIPKFAIVAKPSKETANITARYFVPDNTHSAMSVTGAICLGSCSILKGSVAYDLSTKTMVGDKQKVVIEHPSGSIEVILESEQKEGEVGMSVKSAGILRTARHIATGLLRVSDIWWENDQEKEQEAVPGMEGNKETGAVTADGLYLQFRELFRQSAK